MEALAVIALLLGIHIIIARACIGRLSRFNFYFGLGLLEGLPLIISVVCVYFQFRFAQVLFIAAAAIYFIGVVPVRRWLEGKAIRENPSQWKEWEKTKTNMKSWAKTILFL